MPIYAYRCFGCKHEYEEMNSIDGRYNTQCPECGAHRGIEILIKTCNLLILYGPKNKNYDHIRVTKPEPYKYERERIDLDVCG